MVDDPDAHAGADKRHLETCAECQARFGTVSKDALAISSLMSAPELKVDVASAFDRVRTAPAARPRFGFRLPVMRPGSRPLVLAFATAVAVIALLVTAIA
jgi:anti-sigma factor RsiW